MNLAKRDFSIANILMRHSVTTHSKASIISNYPHCPVASKEQNKKICRLMKQYNGNLAKQKWLKL